MPVFPHDEEVPPCVHVHVTSTAGGTFAMDRATALTIISIYWKCHLKEKVKLRRMAALQ